jgi:periplasmic copper chaperone A
VLSFTGVPAKAKDYAFAVRQTYSDGSVVVWSGDESSDTPAAHLAATAEASSSGGGSDSSKTIAIVALIVGGLGLLVGGAGLLSGRRTA